MKRSQGQGAVLRQGYESSEALEAEVKAHVREVIGAIATPEEVVFVRRLPRPAAARLCVASCAEAFMDIISAVDDEIDLGPIWEEEVEELREGEQHALLSLLMFATDLFAGLASESRFIRRHIAMRKGLFG